MQKNERTKVDCSIIPIPREVAYLDGTVSIAPAIATREEGWKPLINVFSQAVNKIFHTDVKIEQGAIELVRVDHLAKDAYSIEIDKTVTVFAAG